jgi:hypothetical protein
MYEGRDRSVGTQEKPKCFETYYKLFYHEGWIDSWFSIKTDYNIPTYLCYLCTMLSFIKIWQGHQIIWMWPPQIEIAPRSFFQPSRELELGGLYSMTHHKYGGCTMIHSIKHFSIQFKFSGISERRGHRADQATHPAAYHDFSTEEGRCQDCSSDGGWRGRWCGWGG